MAIPLDLSFEAFHIRGKTGQEIVQGLRDSISALTHGDLQAGEPVRASAHRSFGDQANTFCIAEPVSEWVTVVCPPVLMLHILRHMRWSAIGLFGEYELGRRSFYSYWNLMILEEGEIAHWLISKPEIVLGDMSASAANRFLVPFLGVHYPDHKLTTYSQDPEAQLPAGAFWRVEDIPPGWLKPAANGEFLRAKLQEPTHIAYVGLAEALLAPDAGTLTGFRAYDDFWHERGKTFAKKRKGTIATSEQVERTRVLSCEWREGLARQRAEIEYGPLFSWQA